MVADSPEDDQAAQLAADNQRFHDYCQQHGLTPGHLTIPDTSFQHLLNTLYPSKKEQ